MLNEHNDSVLGNLKIHLAGTNEEEHIITSKGRRRLQSHPYYRQIVDHKDDTYWEVEVMESHDSVEGQSGVDDRVIGSVNKICFFLFYSNNYHYCLNS